MSFRAPRRLPAERARDTGNRRKHSLRSPDRRQITLLQGQKILFHPCTHGQIHLPLFFHDAENPKFVMSHMHIFPFPNLSFLFRPAGETFPLCLDRPGARKHAAEGKSAGSKRCALITQMTGTLPHSADERPPDTWRIQQEVMSHRSGGPCPRD